jgi:hypothetical protein
MECWSDGFRGIKTYFTFTTHCSNTPTIPGPDPPATRLPDVGQGWRAGLTDKAGVLQASLARYYGDTNFFQAGRTRAGHHSL